MEKRVISLMLTLSLLLQPLCVRAEEPVRGERERLVREENQSSQDGKQKKTVTEAVQTEAPSVMLMEVSTGTVLSEKNAGERRSPASITKIMTLLLIFEALEKGTLTMEEEVVTSAHAKSMGGSQVFLEEGEKQTVETMIKCIVVASGNDASVAMAEHIAGSEEEFVKRMNQRARSLGMENTNFADCCGLTDSPEHYMTAEDVAKVSRELLSRFPKILDYSSIWMENITHVTRQGTREFGLTNTNKLIRGYQGCIGLKTGSTSKAGFCVSAVAKRGEITLLAVVMGSADSKSRFRDAAAMLNYGFGICNLYTDENQDKIAPAELTGGVEEKVACTYKEPFHYLDTEGKNLEGVEKRLEYNGKLKAPIKKGDTVGRAVYILEGKEIGSVELISTGKVQKAGYRDYLKKAGRNLLRMKKRIQEYKPADRPE